MQEVIFAKSFNLESKNALSNILPQRTQRLHREIPIIKS